MPTPKQELSKYITVSSMSTGYIDQMDLFTVRRYGAVPGTTESQAVSIDATISAAISAGSRIVFFPPGTYYTTSLLDSTSVNFVGDNATFTTNYGGSTYSIQEAFSSTTLDVLITNLRTDLNTHTTNSNIHLNIMSTVGDLITYSTQNEPIRLPRGATNQILTVGANGIPNWIDSASLSSEFSGVEQLMWMLS